MKKVLFASTALVMFAGAASAQGITLSGSAEMGIRGGNPAGVNDGAEFHQDIDVTFTMAGETDGGLSFGAAVDLDEAAGSVDDDDAGVAVFISGGFGTLTLGDTDGAMDWALTEGGNVANGGSIADNETGYAGYAGSYLDGAGDGQILRYDYSFGDYAVAISVEQDDAPNAASGLVNAGNGDTGIAIGFKGTVAGLSFGIAHQEAAGSDADMTGVSLGYSANGFSAGVMYATGEDATATDNTLLQVGVGYSANGLSLHANYQDSEVGTTSTDGWGVAAGYDLGGGATLKAGFNSDDEYSLGVAMSF